MPERRGRRHRNRDRRAGAGPGEAPPGASVPAPITNVSPAPTPQQPRALPSRTARLSGFALALITALLGIAMFADAFGGNNGTPEVFGRVIAGSLLVGLAVFVSALVLFPAQIRDYLYRRQERRNAARGS